jgi:hypothetical protein
MSEGLPQVSTLQNRGRAILLAFNFGGCQISERQEEGKALAPAMDSRSCFPRLAIREEYFNYRG